MSDQPRDPTEELMRKIAAEGDATGEFTKEEKLALVASELMAPEEIGLASAEEAKLQLMPDAEKQVKFGDIVEFAASVVPLVVRANWALTDTKLVLAPTEKAKYIEDWIAEHKNEFLIQGKMHCGTAFAQFQRTFKDPILGLSAMLRLCGDMLEKKYLGEELPPAVEPQLEKRNAIDKN